jgi:hypothetical protein
MVTRILTASPVVVGSLASRGPGHCCRRLVASAGGVKAREAGGMTARRYALFLGCNVPVRNLGYELAARRWPRRWI